MGSDRAAPHNAGGLQRIPRPPNHREGAPAPWETGEWKVPTVTSADIVAALHSAGRSSIPRSYEEAWLGTELTPRQRLAADRALKSGRPTSAVLVPVFDSAGAGRNSARGSISGNSGSGIYSGNSARGGTGGGEIDRGGIEARLILTRRSKALRSHTGEVAFPGGMVDDGELPHEAAVREAHEEVALSPSAVRLVGHLEAMPTIASGTWIMPFVGVLDGKPHLDPNPDEVERVFDVSIGELTAPGVFREEIWEFPGFGDGPVSFFEVDGDTIWGATARMVRNLLDILAAA